MTRPTSPCACPGAVRPRTCRVEVRLPPGKPLVVLSALPLNSRDDPGGSRTPKPTRKGRLAAAARTEPDPAFFHVAPLSSSCITGRNLAGPGLLPSGFSCVLSCSCFGGYACFLPHSASDLAVQPASYRLPPWRLVTGARSHPALLSNLVPRLHAASLSLPHMPFHAQKLSLFIFYVVKHPAVAEGGIEPPARPRGPACHQAKPGSTNLPDVTWTCRAFATTPVPVETYLVGRAFPTTRCTQNRRVPKA